jgi:hypothetical protein
MKMTRIEAETTQLFALSHKEADSKHKLIHTLNVEQYLSRVKNTSIDIYYYYFVLLLLLLKSLCLGTKSDNFKSSYFRAMLRSLIKVQTAIFS